MRNDGAGASSSGSGTPGCKAARGASISCATAPPEAPWRWRLPRWLTREPNAVLFYFWRGPSATLTKALPRSWWKLFVMSTCSWHSRLSSAVVQCSRAPSARPPPAPGAHYKHGGARRRTQRARRSGSSHFEAHRVARQEHHGAPHAARNLQRARSAMGSRRRDGSWPQGRARPCASGPKAPRQSAGAGAGARALDSPWSRSDSRA